jgi:hypothetical protein
MNNSIVIGSQSDIASKQNISLAESFLNAEMVLLVDVSGSMVTNDAPNRMTRWKYAQEQLTNLQGLYPGKIALVEFSSNVFYRPNGQLSPPNGSTAMHKGLDFVKVADDCGIKIIIVSDGDPDSKDQAINIASKFKTQIDAIYCGREGGLGQQFLQKLVNKTGGQFFKTAEPGMIGEGIELLLLEDK